VPYLRPLSPEVGCSDYLTPAISFLDDEFSEVGGRASHSRSTQLIEARHYGWIGNSGIDLLVEDLSDFGG
jgi:hypothetical protein